MKEVRLLSELHRQVSSRFQRKLIDGSKLSAVQIREKMRVGPFKMASYGHKKVLKARHTNFKNPRWGRIAAGGGVGGGDWESWSLRWSR